jgi:hypothetical protein
MMNEQAGNDSDERAEPDPAAPGWVEKHQVRTITGWSERQIDELANQNKIRHRDQPRLGRRPSVVYWLPDVNAVMKEKLASHPTAVTEQQILFMQQLIGELYVENRKMREMLTPSFLQVRR